MVYGIQRTKLEMFALHIKRTIEQESLAYNQGFTSRKFVRK